MFFLPVCLTDSFIDLHLKLVQCKRRSFHVISNSCQVLLHSSSSVTNTACSSVEVYWFLKKKQLKPVEEREPTSEIFSKE